MTVLGGSQGQHHARPARGIFDRSTSGFEFPPVTVTIERSAILLFAETLGANCATHQDPIVAPPTFFTVIDALADMERRRLGQPTILDHIGCDTRYLLHGEEVYDFNGPIRSGDLLTIKARVSGFYDSRGGGLEFAVIEQHAIDTKRGELVRARRTYIHKFPS